MEVLISNWKNVKSVPKSYILPPNRRPGNHTVPILRDIPVIDLQHFPHNRAQIIQQILKASQEFGLFQVINHGVSTSLMDETMNLLKEFFGMPAEYKGSFYSNDPNFKSCRLFTSTLNYDTEEVHYWRDNLTHRCHPLEDHIQSWPPKPTTYRETVGLYSLEVRGLSMRILDMISEGLGLELGFFEGELSKIQLMSVNHHIPCPDPTLALGVPEHSDPNLITMLHQGNVSGLHIFKDGQWMGVEPLPNAFLVFVGLQLRVISNENFKSPIHRVVTHAKEPRTTIGTFINPSNEFLIEPARATGNKRNPAVYRAYMYKEFLNSFIENGCEAESSLECFRLHN